MGRQLHWADEQTYFRHAVWTAQGQWLGPHGFTLVPPGQPYSLALLFLLTGPSVLAARLLQVLASAASVWLAYRLARRVSPGAAALAAWLLALYPLVAYTSGTLYPQSLAMLLLLGCLNLLADHADRPSGPRLAAAGVMLGLAALTVPTVLSVSPVLAAWLWWIRRARWRGALEVAALAACCALTLAPWTLRNYVVEHRFVPIAGVGAQAFFFANNPNADPDSKDLGIVDRIYTPEVEAEIARTGNPDAVYTRHALEFMRRQPGQFLGFYLRRLGHVFDFYPTTFTRTSHSGLAGRLVVGLTSGPALLLALLGAWPLLRRSRHGALWVALPLAWAAASALFGVSIRYRIPVEPCILAVAAWTLWRYVFRMEDPVHEVPARRPARPA